MARNHEKKALYEVLSKATWPKSNSDKALETPLPPPPVESGEDKQPETRFQAPVRARWLNRPRIVQINAGRIEVSIPYQLAIAVLLGFILLVLIAFKLGQGSQKITGPAANKAAASTQKTSPKIIAAVPQETVRVKENALAPIAQKVEPVTVSPKGDNRIVIQSYQLRADLEPVKQYFAGFGIETEILKIDAWYYLVTKDKYENPGKPGTDGYLAKQKIIELGAKYKAPIGNETFGIKPFSDAYGKKFDE